MKILAILAVAALGVLAGCATQSAGPTRYVKAEAARGASYGYRDKEIGGGEFSIVATGNRLTSKKRVAEIALLRAARITQEHGKTHFVILKRKAGRLQNLETESVTLFIGGAFVWLPVGQHSTMEPMTVLVIRLLPLQAEYPREAIDAAKVVEHLAARVESRRKLQPNQMKAKASNSAGKTLLTSA